MRQRSIRPFLFLLLALLLGTAACQSGADEDAAPDAADGIEGPAFLYFYTDN